MQPAELHKGKASWAARGAPRPSRSTGTSASGRAWRILLATSELAIYPGLAFPDSDGFGEGRIRVDSQQPRRDILCCMLQYVWAVSPCRNGFRILTDSVEGRIRVDSGGFLDPGNGVSQLSIYLKWVPSALNDVESSICHATS